MNPITISSNSKTAHEIEQEENVVWLLESDVWNSTIKGLFQDNLKSAKNALLNNIGLPTDTRVGYIMYRQKVMDSFKALYRKHNIQIPEWLEV
jgi:small ligand-binding sensory domain FIST